MRSAAILPLKMVEKRPENDGFRNKAKAISGRKRSRSIQRDKSDNTTKGLIIGAIGIAIMPSFGLRRPSSCLLRSIPFIAFIPSCCLLCPIPFILFIRQFSKNGYNSFDK